MSGRPSFSFPPTPQDWARIQDVVRLCYVDRKLPLKEVRLFLRDRYNFRATDRMIKARLKQWGYLKNAKREDWLFLALLHDSRQASGQAATVFDVRGHRKTVKDLHRFIRNQDMSAEAFLNEARAKTRNRDVPDYIQALTPESEHDQEHDHEEISDSNLAPFASPAPHPFGLSLHTSAHHELDESPDRDLKTGPSSIPSDQTRSNHLFNSSMLDQPHKSWQISSTNLQRMADDPCNQIQTELEMLASQITSPAPLMSRIGQEDISSWALVTGSPSGSERSGGSSSFVCSRCNQPSDQHFVELERYESSSGSDRDILNGNDHTLHLPVSTRDEGSWLWVSRCFLACMCLKKGDQDAAQQSLGQATKEFERLLARKDSQLLTAAGLVMTILHMHDQSEIAKTVIASAYAVTERLLPLQHPTRVTFHYLTASANLQQKEMGFSSDTMRQVYWDYLDYYAADHEYVIAARYNYSWMLKFEGNWAAAESEAREVYRLSCSALGKIHMQSVTALAVVAGCLAGQGGRNEECICIYTTVVKNASKSVGRHHPYTLEAKRRLAIAIEEQTGSDRQTIQLYKDVLYGRAHMLGLGHPYTIGAKEDYEQRLQTSSMWVDGEGRPTEFQRDVIDLFSPDSPGSWTKISRRRTLSQESRLVDWAAGSGRASDDDDEDEEESDVIMVETRVDGSQSPRSAHEFEAY